MLAVIRGSVLRILLVPLSISGFDTAVAAITQGSALLILPLLAVLGPSVLLILPVLTVCRPPVLQYLQCSEYEKYIRSICAALLPAVPVPECQYSSATPVAPDTPGTCSYLLYNTEVGIIHIGWYCCYCLCSVLLCCVAVYTRYSSIHTSTCICRYVQA